MKIYLKNIKNTLKIYKDGRWNGNMNVYKFIIKYTIKYVKVNVFNVR